MYEALDKKKVSDVVGMNVSLFIHSFNLEGNNIDVLYEEINR